MEGSRGLDGKEAREKPHLGHESGMMELYFKLEEKKGGKWADLASRRKGSK